MILEWSVLALGDRNAIFDYILAESPRAAIDTDDRIRETVERLAAFPESGRPGRIDGTVARHFSLGRSRDARAVSIGRAGYSSAAREAAARARRCWAWPL